MAYVAIGEYDEAKAGHGEAYFAIRHCTMDYRGDLRISKLSSWGFGVMVMTASHDIIETGEYSGVMIMKRVWVDDNAWITSGCILYNCHIQHHAIVAIGSVVSNMVVEPYHVVAGNPASVIAAYDIEAHRWRRVSEVSERATVHLDIPIE
jgi:acetyltransferase-like isoleucine patch superfamily enzyme